MPDTDGTEYIVICSVWVTSIYNADVFRRKESKKFDLALNLLYNLKNSKMVLCTPKTKKIGNG